MRYEFIPPVAVEGKPSVCEVLMANSVTDICEASMIFDDDTVHEIDGYHDVHELEVLKRLVTEANETRRLRALIGRSSGVAECEPPE